MLVNLIIICFLFPLTILTNSKPNKRTELLTVCDKYDSTIIKGIAAWMVVFAHYIVYLEENGVVVGLLKNVYAFGSMGVGIFFFMSGYGMFVSGSKLNRLDYKWIIKRIKTLIIPYIIIQSIEYLILNFPSYSYRIYEYWLGIKVLRWYIIASVILYFGWFLVFNFCKRKLLSMFFWVLGVILLFYVLKFADYWYATLILFFLGMLFARYKDPIMIALKNKWFFYTISSLVLWGGAILLYAVTKAILFKTLISVFLVLIIILVLMKLRISSKLMYLTGVMSLYVYLVHLALIDILAQYGSLIICSPVYGLLLFCITTFSISWLFSKVVDIIINGKYIKRIYRGDKR